MCVFIAILYFAQSLIQSVECMLINKCTSNYITNAYRLYAASANAA